MGDKDPAEQVMRTVIAGIQLMIAAVFVNYPLDKFLAYDISYLDTVGVLILLRYAIAILQAFALVRIEK